ncbi:MAG: hypothetical protein WAW03_15260 [Anaerolineae bacterium]|uniref:hypothetical protein n=1 Tax=Candidatus Amarolinea dominans TaxID=3140696 RepID=UPI0031365F71|nr:hypothetical protein [Anaerolineae bacterium]
MNLSRRARLLLGLLLSLLIIFIFAARAFRHAPRPLVDETIQPWMSVGYIARSYRVPPTVLLETLGLPARSDHRPLSAVAAEQKRPVNDLIAILNQTITAYRAANPTSALQTAEPQHPPSLLQRLFGLEPRRAP